MGVDRQALHEYLWRKRNRLGKLVINQKQLADDLGVNKWTMSRIMHELADDGRIRVIGRTKHTIATFAIEDPEGWKNLA